MKSLLVEFHRFDDLTSGSLRKGDRYLIAAASHPVRETKMPLGHAEFLDYMLVLRYQSSVVDREGALQKVGQIVYELLGKEFMQSLKDNDQLLQLDLVVNAAELAAIPFEAVLDSEGIPLLAKGNRCIELTRRVRHDFSEISVRWPARPRILFAWACPHGTGISVPYEEHEAALRAALEPWLPSREIAGDIPVYGDEIITLPSTSLEMLEEACKKAVADEKPFSHVHILAHGYPFEQKHRQRFGMALHGEDGDLKVVAPEEVAKALEPLAGLPVVVTLAICDSANCTNTLIPERSIAHELHVLGFPVVLASQLPLTIAGSNLLTEHFYQALMAGKDIREALHESRILLYDNSDTTGHDWASLVGYIRLPEGYAEHLLDVRLESIMASLKAIQATSDQLIKSNTISLEEFDKIEKLLQGRIEALIRFLDDIDGIKKKGVLEENLGLLGSATKRLAELYFRHGKLSQHDNQKQLMLDELKNSLNWYRRGFEYNLSHHWTGVQYLSLESVLYGAISDPDHWCAALAAAKIDSRKPKAYWAFGTLAELYLLAPLANQESHAIKAVEALNEMVSRVKKFAGGDNFPLDSTRRQLRRYIDWWTSKNGFFPGTSDVAAEAERLEKVLSEGEIFSA